MNKHKPVAKSTLTTWQQHKLPGLTYMKKAQYSFIAQVTILHFYVSISLQMNYKVHRNTLVANKDTQKNTCLMKVAM